MNGKNVFQNTFLYTLYRLMLLNTHLLLSSNFLCNLFLFYQAIQHVRLLYHYVAIMCTFNHIVCWFFFECLKYWFKHLGGGCHTIYFKQGKGNQPFFFKYKLLFYSRKLGEHTWIGHKDLDGRTTLTEDHCDENNSTDSFTGQHE